MIIVGVRFRSQGPAMVIDEAVFEGSDNEAPTKMEKKMAREFKNIAMLAFKEHLTETCKAEGDGTEMHFAEIDAGTDPDFQKQFDSQSFFAGISGIMRTFFNKLPEGLPRFTKVEG